MQDPLLDNIPWCHHCTMQFGPNAQMNEEMIAHWAWVSRVCIRNSNDVVHNTTCCNLVCLPPRIPTQSRWSKWLCWPRWPSYRGRSSSSRAPRWCRSKTTRTGPEQVFFKSLHTAVKNIIRCSVKDCKIILTAIVVNILSSAEKVLTIMFALFCAHVNNKLFFDHLW